MDAEDHKAHARTDRREHLLRDIRIDDSFEVMNKEAAFLDPVWAFCSQLPGWD